MEPSTRDRLPGAKMREASTFRHRPAGANRPRRGPAKVIQLPAAKMARRRRAIKAGFGLLILSLVGAILARLYLSRSTSSPPGKIVTPAEPASTPRIAIAN